MQRQILCALFLLAILVAVAVFWQLHYIGIALVNEYDCGMEEHEHTDECWETVLVCDIPEYVHSAKCLSNNGADAEDGDDWLETLPELSGVWAEDVVAVAESQLGYMESEQNYIVDDDGERRGYTRYGAWYGNDYGAWDAMFAAFCLNYTDVEDFPANSGAYAWLVELEDAGLYAEAAEHTPTGGDIIFFDSDGDGRAERAGVVNGTDDDGMTVIEGDSNDAVEENDYSPTNETILGYGVLPADEAAETETEAEIESETELDAEKNAGEYTEAEAGAEAGAETEAETEGETKPETEAKADTGAGTKADAEEAAETLLFTASDGGVTVTAETQPDALPENAAFGVSILDEGSDEYASAAEAVGHDTGSEESGMAALDITFYDEEGTEIEPTQSVTVSIDISTTAYFSTDGGTTYVADDDLDPVSGTLWIAYDNEVDFDDGNSLLAVEEYTLDSAVLYVPNNQGTYTSYTISGIRATYNWSAGTWTYQYLPAGSDTWTTFSASVSVTTGGGREPPTTTTYTAYLELFYIKDEVEVTGELYITDDIERSSSLVATYDGTADISEGYYYVWYKLNTDTGEYEEIEGEIEQSLAVYIDGARQTYKVELVRTSDNAVVATSEHYQVPYYDQLQNGSFEEPTVSGSAQLTNGLYEELVWQTTGFGSSNTNREADGQDIEIVNASAAGSSYGETLAADGDQYAELNCEAAGTLYQDVLTIPEVPLYWQASHEGCDGSDTMCVIIVDAAFADSYISTQEQVDAVIAASGLSNPSDNESAEVTFTYTDAASGASTSTRYGSSPRTPTAGTNIPAHTPFRKTNT
ncbi:MAG: hypothetical protein LUD54_00045 [Oscillospiraceae bacterium]|nr:hypothetical protein [Oscillospiraceae bacterium]